MNKLLPRDRRSSWEHQIPDYLMKSHDTLPPSSPPKENPFESGEVNGITLKPETFRVVVRALSGLRKIRKGLDEADDALQQAYSAYDEIFLDLHGLEQYVEKQTITKEEENQRPTKKAETETVEDTMKEEAKVTAGKVYIITSGGYSDYHIDWVFSTREKAEAWLKLVGKPSFEERKIEEYPLDSEYNPRFWINVQMDKGGNVIGSYNQTTFTLDEELELCKPGLLRWSGTDRFILTVQTNNLQQAVKVANELRTHILATETWGKNPESFIDKEVL